MKYQTDEDGNVWSYKKVNVEKKDGNHLVQVWDKTVFSDKGREKRIQERIKEELSTEVWDKLSEEQNMSEVDCKKQGLRSLSFIDRDRDGKVLVSRDYNKNEWIYMTPGSVGEDFTKEVCK